MLVLLDLMDAPANKPEISTNDILDIFNNAAVNNNNSSDTTNNQNKNIDFSGTSNTPQNQINPQINYGQNTQNKSPNITSFSDNISNNLTSGSTIQNQKQGQTPLDLLESELADLDLTAEPPKNQNQKKEYK